jgi:endonuclease/exonuclease/phosphatase (EEP) superfamily protein YafD
MIDQPTPKRAKSKPRPVLLALVILYQIVIFAAPFFPFDSLAHSLLTYAPPQLLAIPLAIFAIISLVRSFKRGHTKLQLFTLVLIALSIPFFYSYHLPLSKPAGQPDLRVLTVNILFTNREVPDLVTYIQSEKIDLIFLQENEGGPESPASYIHTKLPHFYLFKDGSTAILSRWPLSETKSIPQKSLVHRRILTARVNAPTPFRAGTLHWSVPQISQGLDRFAASVPKQIADFDQTLPIFENESLPLVFGGDFNNPPRHHHTRILSQKFTNAFTAVGSGPGLTYSSETPLVRIDHFYSNSKLTPLSCSPGPSFGSDHLSLRADFTFNTSAK